MFAGSQNSPSLGYSCRNEVFKIYKASGSGVINKGDLVHLEKKWCDSPYVTGKDGKWIETTNYNGLCETWEIRK